MDSQKLKIKDIITITLLALINVILFMFSSLLYVTPITTLLMPVIYSLIEGIVFFTINVKVQKRGAAFLYCLIRGIRRLSSIYNLLRCCGNNCGNHNWENGLWKGFRNDNKLHNN